MLAAKEVSEKGYDEGLLCDVDGRLVSGSKSNVFIVDEGVLKTPELNNCGVAGVMREAVIGLCAKNKIELHETAIDWQTLETADEVFLTNALIEILPVKQIAGRVNRELATGSVTLNLQRLMRTHGT